MLLVQFLGQHSEVIKTVRPPPLCVTVAIYETNGTHEIREHFPKSEFPAWTGKTRQQPDEVS